VLIGSLTDHGYGSLIAGLVLGVETIISELVSILRGKVDVLLVSFKEGVVVVMVFIHYRRVLQNYLLVDNGFIFMVCCYWLLPAVTSCYRMLPAVTKFYRCVKGCVKG